jgi:hypothetical protein
MGEEQMAQGYKHSEQQPSGFTPQSGGLSSEYAREQGWGINQDERAKTPVEKQDFDGGRDYGYGAHDFGDSPTRIALPKAPQHRKSRPMPKKTADKHA